MAALTNTIAIRFHRRDMPGDPHEKMLNDLNDVFAKYSKILSASLCEKNLTAMASLQQIAARIFFVDCP